MNLVKELGMKPLLALMWMLLALPVQADTV